MQSKLKSIYHHLAQRPVKIAPLVSFRILFGALMAIGAVRFMASGWIEELYLDPDFFFKFHGFEWVQPFGKWGMYALFFAIAGSSVCILLGLFYRIATVVFFLSFTYVELIDATNYLNHYYLVCLLGFLLIFLPANRQFSLDVLMKPELKRLFVPAWTINILIFQLTLVYTCAGIAKLNYDWLVHAMPLAIWLPEHQDLPVLGYFFQFKWFAYFFSWAGAFYDLTIAYFLMYRKTRPVAYLFVIFFHVMTKVLFNIGLFPFIMISSTLIFFSGEWHERFLSFLGLSDVAFGTSPSNQSITNQPSGIQIYNYKSITKRFLKPVLFVFVLLQLLLPFRFMFYKNHLLWAEEGYRFSWRVMLVEKTGLVTFLVKDSTSPKQSEIINSQYLTSYQEKQMSIQADFILQFAHFLKKEYEQKHGFINPEITVDAHVALNGRISQRFIDPEVNLAMIDDGFGSRPWVLPFKQ